MTISMTTAIPQEFIRRIPKTDLHLHLDGSLRLPTLIELAKKEGVELPSYEEAGLREGVKIMIGGAPVTQAFADEIGVDFYGAEPAAGKDYVKGLVG